MTAQDTNCMSLVGMELSAATTACPEFSVQKTMPPHGLPAYAGTWRVVRVCPEDKCLTAAYFPLLQNDSRQEEAELCNP